MLRPRGSWNTYAGVLTALLRRPVHRFSGRPFTATIWHAKQLAGAAPFKRKRWTIEEDRKLVELRESGIPSKDILRHFPDRSLASVRSRVRSLDLGAAEDSTRVGTVNGLAGSQTPHQGSAHDGTRGAHALQQESETMEQQATSGEADTRAPGIKAPPNRRFFTAAEHAQLSSLVESGLTWPAIRKKMPSRRASSLFSHWYRVSNDRSTKLWASDAQSFAHKGRWSEAEIEQLKRLKALGKRTDYIARALGRTRQATKWRSWSLDQKKGDRTLPEANPDSIDPQIGTLRDHETATDKR